MFCTHVYVPRGYISGAAALVAILSLLNQLNQLFYCHSADEHTHQRQFDEMFVCLFVCLFQFRLLVNWSFWPKDPKINEWIWQEQELNLLAL